MAPIVNAPCFDGEGDSSSNYAQEVEWWRRATNLEPARTALSLILNTDPAARGACLAAGRDQGTDREGVSKITQVLNAYFAPDDLGEHFTFP